MYKECRNYENINNAVYPGVGQYQIPQIQPVEYTGCKWIGFNYASSRRIRKGYGLHFFLDDYQFVRLWSNVNNYIPMLQQYDYVMSPDFSMYRDYPFPLQLYNHYRKHWLAAYMQENGIKVIPSICWSDESSYEWCFDGEPTHSVVAVSSVGTGQNKYSREFFLQGYEEMYRRLKPTKVLFYGSIPPGCRGDVEQIEAFQKKFTKEMT